jgi:LysR family transcriptional regulator, glycine cleavage system transcriptional activator
MAITRRTRKLPPLNAVRTFEAAARHVSFTKAANEIHVTHGAVSRQVAVLEKWFGIPLFRRTASQVTLTEAGQSYYREVTGILDRLELASKDMRHQAASTTLRVNAPPTFTMRWLIRRIAAFQRRRPDVELRLTTALGPINANDSGLDVGIRGNEGELPGWRSHHFMTELIAPVCHVDLLKHHKIQSPRDLAQLRLLTYLTEPYDWQQWFARAASRMATDQETLRFEQMYFALQATQERMGIGLFPLFLVIDELIAGELCVPFGELGVRQRDYLCFYRVEHETWPIMAAFRDWLTQAGDETEMATLRWAEGAGWNLSALDKTHAPS